MSRPSGAASTVFRERFFRLRSRLDPTLAARVSELLAHIPTRNRTALEATLTRGKKLRGTLLCLVAEALGGDLEQALPRAVAVELVQAASLIHDDVVDGDTLRRGAPAVWALEGGRRAILIGDVLFASAIASMAALSREDGLVIAGAIEHIALGACLEPVDLPLALRFLEEDENPRVRYESIIRLKTAILFEAACRMAALAAGADFETSDRWGHYGLLIGEAYQIADDLHDLRAAGDGCALQPDRLAPLVPALLGYSTERRGAVSTALRAGRWEDAVQLARPALSAMEGEVERRLAKALEAANSSTPTAAVGGLLSTAPWEIIRLFEQEEALTCPSSR